MKKRILILLLSCGLIMPYISIEAEDDLQKEYEELLASFQALEEQFSEFQEHYNQVYGETEFETEISGSEQNDLNVGVLDNWEIEISDIEFCDEITADYGSYKADDGSLYVVVSLTVTNTGTASDTFLPSFAIGNDVTAKIYVGEYEYSSTYLISNSEDLHDTTLNPLISKSGIIVFSVSESLADENNRQIVFSSGENMLSFEL